MGDLFLDQDKLFWRQTDTHPSCKPALSESHLDTLCWEMSRVKDFHCYLQPQEVPYCSISVYSDRSDVSIDTFIFNQPCESDLGSFSLYFITRRLAVNAGTRPSQTILTANLLSHEREPPSRRIR